MDQKLYLLWKFNNLDNLESDIEKALGRWEEKPKLKGYLPEAIILPLSLSDIVKEEYLMTLEVKFEKTVQDSHFMIEGIKYK